MKAISSIFLDNVWQLVAYMIRRGMTSGKQSCVTFSFCVTRSDAPRILYETTKCVKNVVIVGETVAHETAASEKTIVGAIQSTLVDETVLGETVVGEKSSCA